MPTFSELTEVVVDRIVLTSFVIVFHGLFAYLKYDHEKEDPQQARSSW